MSAARKGRLNASTSPSSSAATEEIIEEARRGRMFILVDDEDRENEGDLVIPGAVRHAGSHQLHGHASAAA